MGAKAVKRKTIIWSIVGLLVVVITVGLALYAFDVKANEPEPTAETRTAATQTAVASLGDLVVFASGTGEVVPLQETTLSFDEQGTLVEILVGVGDQVATGDVLARLRVNKSGAQLAADIAQAKLTVLENQQALDSLYADAEVQAAQALVDLETAQQDLEAVLNNDLELAQAKQTVVEAQAAIDDAEMQLYILNASPSDEAIYTAYASLLFKEKRYNELKNQVERLEYKLKTAGIKAMRDQISSQLRQVRAQFYKQQIVYEEALYHYNNLDAPADSLDLKVAQSRMDTAQAQLDQANLALAEAQQGPPQGEIAQAQAKVAQAQAEWEQWKDGPDPQEVTLVEARLATSQLELQIVQQENLVVDLVAPMDGTVISLPVAVNQFIDGDNIITLADTSQPMLEVSLDETDFQSAKVGNRVEVTFDAYPNRTFSGAIAEVSPGLESTFGSQAVKVLAILDQDTNTKSVSLPLGLNASVDVISGEATNAVLVPIEALHQTETGNYMVYVQNNGLFEPREVNVGLMDFTSAEIISGLQVGEVVAISDITNQ
jgi:HlyD family secretion protein